LLLRLVIVFLSAGSFLVTGNFVGCLLVIVDIRVTCAITVGQQAALKIIKQALKSCWREVVQAFHEGDKPAEVPVAAGKAV
jgi:hypothetical protein